MTKLYLIIAENFMMWKSYFSEHKLHLNLKQNWSQFNKRDYFKSIKSNSFALILNSKLSTLSSATSLIQNKTDQLYHQKFIV